MKITCTDYTDFYTCIKGIYFVFLLLMFKRLFYLVGINIAILITINILIVIAQRVFGIVIEPSSYTGLIIFGIVFGFGGAIVNLLISRWSAKRLYKIQLFDESIGSEKLKVVYRTVQEIAYNHKITIPEVGVYEAAEVNAFATWASKNKSLVAVSSWLIETMTSDEIHGVVGHEMSHILNGDMVTSTLLQWSLNAFTIIAARIVGGIVDGAINRNSESSGWGIWYYLIVNILNVVFGALAGLILMAHSRAREYKADLGGARYTSREKMLSGLRKLSQIAGNPVPQDGFATMKFAGGGKLAVLFSSHPPIEKRISALENDHSL